MRTETSNRRSRSRCFGNSTSTAKSSVPFPGTYEVGAIITDTIFNSGGTTGPFFRLTASAESGVTNRQRRQAMPIPRTRAPHDRDVLENIRGMDVTPQRVDCTDRDRLWKALPSAGKAASGYHRESELSMTFRPSATSLLVSWCFLLR
jgi:hypothetical protein